MIVRGFKSVLWVGAVGSAALSCYMVSLRVATERADLARVQGQIVDAKRDIRSLQTELGTRGRLTQLEDWNTNVLALSAPASNQFVKDGFALARLQTHEPTVEERNSEVRLASAETGAAAPAPETKPAAATAAAEPAKAKAAPDATPLPRVVQAVAAAPAQVGPSPIRRASFTTSEAPAAPEAKPAKTPVVHEAAAAAPKPAKPKVVTVASDASVKPAAPRKPKLDATAGHEPHAATRVAAADKPVTPKAAPQPTPAKPVSATAKLAHADAGAHAPSSGHRGGAQ
jgi:hypothetical protein